MSRFINGEIVLAGNTSGTAVPAGRVGEVVSQSGSMAITAPNTTEADVPNSTLVLTPGVWLVSYSVNVQIQTGSSANNASRFFIKLTDSSDTLINNSIRSAYAKTVAASANIIECVLSDVLVLNIPTTTTYKLRFKRTDDSGTGTASVLNNTLNHASSFRAVRIA